MPEALTEVMTGRVDFSCSSISAALPFIQDGKLLALAVTTPQRSSTLPNVPTSLELGYANSDYTFWTGMFAPAKTPRDLIEKLHAEVQKAIAMPGVKEKLAVQGVDPMPVGATAFDAQVKAEVESNIALAKAAGIKAN
jgi:tripartite-type tricarboxylate transporter receptor subunit TctC